MSGLDCYWSVPGGAAPRFSPALSVVYPRARLPGRVYAEAVQAVSGRSLFQDRLDAGEVQAIADLLADFAPDEAFFDEFGITPQEFRDLERLFAGYAGLGASLVVLW